MPKPKRIDGRVMWDRWKIDAAFSDLPGDEPDLAVRERNIVL